jgi:hypothetical protein
MQKNKGDMVAWVERAATSLAQLGRQCYRVSGEAIWVLVLVGVATGHVYLRADGGRIAARVDLHDLGWTMELVVLTLTACNLWRHAALVCAVAGVGTACAFFALIVLGARLSSGDWQLVRVV